MLWDFFLGGWKHSSAVLDVIVHLNLSPASYQNELLCNAVSFFSPLCVPSLPRLLGPFATGKSWKIFHSACCWEGWYSKCEMGWNWMIRWSKRNNRWVAQRLIGRSGARWRSLGWGWGGVKRGIGSFIFTWRESWKTAKNGGIVQSAKTRNHKKNWLSFLYTLRQWPMASFWGFFFTKGEFAISQPALLGNGCLCNVFVFLVVFLLRKHSPSSSCMALLGEGACATEWR